MANKDNSSSYGAMPDAEAGDPPVKLSESLIMSGPKQGHSFCGCCCDVRRATIIINICTIVSIIYSVASFYVMQSVLQLNTDSIQDDEVKQQMEAMDPSSIYTPLVISVLVLRSLGSIAAIVGAMKYIVWPVIVNFVILIVIAIPGIVTSVQAGTPAAFIILIQIVNCFFIYPQVMLVYEIKGSKTMSQQSYPREEQSCCCVSTKYRDNTY